MTVITRSGIPQVVTGTAKVTPATTQEATVIQGTPTTWLSFTNEDQNNPIKLYFTIDDFNNDRNFERVKQSERRDFPVELFGNKGLWVRAENAGDPTATAAFRCTYAQRVV